VNEEAKDHWGLSLQKKKKISLRFVGGTVVPVHAMKAYGK
jgi:hypothetical protein